MGLVVGILVAVGLLVLRYRRSCVFNGKRYYSVEGIPSPDCNALWCENGRIMTTLKGCSPYRFPKECYLRDDAIDIADWRVSTYYRDEVSGQVVNRVEFLRMESVALYWLFQVGIHSTRLPPMVRSVWVLKEHCQSGMSESEGDQIFGGPFRVEANQSKIDAW